MLFMVIFFFEMTMKLIALGFAFHEKAYLRNGWNILDFVVVLLSLIAIILDNVTDTPVSFLRAFRAFRAFRLMGRFKRTRVVVLVLIKCIPAVVNVVIFTIFLWLIGAVIGVQLFQGRTALCNDLTVINKFQCVGTFVQDGVSIPRQWEQREWGSFDNIGMSLKTLFPIIGISGWNDVMYATMDITGINIQPQRERAPGMLFLF